MSTNKHEQPKQKTKTGHEIPVPEKDEFFDTLKKASKPSPPEDEKEESDPSGGGEEE